MPYFKFITKFNFYEYLLDKFDNRQGYFTGLEYKVASSDENYLLDYTGWVLVTDFKYLSKTSDFLSLYVPIFILHTWDTLYNSWDSLFTGLDEQRDFNWYYQYITWWNDYIDIWAEIIEKQYTKQTLYLGYLYTYCSMSWTWRIDAYYYDRYIEYNKNSDDKNETLVVGSYVCDINSNIWEYTVTECVAWNRWGFCLKTEDRTYNACVCEDKWEYKICSQNNDINTNPDLVVCRDTSGECLDYIKWTINLNDTNCSLSGATAEDTDKAKYFLIR